MTLQYKKGYKILFDYLKMNSDLLDDKNKPVINDNTDKQGHLLNKLHELGLIK